MNTTLIESSPARVTRPVPKQRFTTQLKMEVRKLVDTRSGLALLGVIVVACAGAMVWLLAHSDHEVSYHRYSTGAANIAALFVPVLALLAMTSEWTQRTALTTFTLWPRRGRVLGAKYLAALIVSCTAVAGVLVLAAGATALGGAIHGHASWADAATDVRGYFLVAVLELTMAAAFGALAGQTAGALVAYFVAPTVWGAVGPNVFGTSSRWLDIFETYGRLTSFHPTDHLGQTLTSIAFWIALPAAFGIRRSLRREIK